MVETSTKYLTFRPTTRNYIPLEKNLFELDRIEIKLANEKGQLLNIPDDENFGETYLTVHVIDQSYLKS